MTNTIWVVVAGAAHVDIYTCERLGGHLSAIETYSRPDARLREQELVSDSPGRSFDSGGQGRHSMEDKTSAKRHLMTQFAKNIGRRIESARVADEFDQLVIVAGPRFLGEVRQALSGPCKKLVIKEIVKDLEGQPDTDITWQLHNLLESA